MFAGCSVVSGMLFTPVDIGKVEVSCYDYIWCFLCVLYSFVRGSCKASSDWRWSLGGGGSVVGGKVNGFISCKMNFCSDGVIVG